MPGAYTRYGDVTELVRVVDDHFAILAAGDEGHARFPASAFRPCSPRLPADLPAQERQLLQGHGSLHGWVGPASEPLPFHAMKSYPYGPGEHDPDTSATRRYRQQFNTRVVAGPPGNLTPPANLP